MGYLLPGLLGLRGRNSCLCDLRSQCYLFGNIMIHCRIGSYFLTLELTSWHGYNYIIVLKRFWSFQKVSARLGCDADTFSAHASRQSGSIPMDRIKTENFTTLQHKDTVLPVANLVDHQFYQCAGWLSGQILIRFYSTIVLSDDTTMGGDRGFTTFNYRLIFWYDFWVGRCVVEIVSTMDLLGDYVRVFDFFSNLTLELTTTLTTSYWLRCWHFCQ